ncbi:MAG: hypothetical protein Q9166_001620 [cf. Caloplaca sp. 2 TL-2023]
MECTFCQRDHIALPFLCAACARDALYQTRVSLAHTLLEQEAAGSLIEQKLKKSESIHFKPSASTSSTAHGHPSSPASKSTNIHQEAVRHRTQMALTHSGQQRVDISELRDEVASRRVRSMKRRTDLTAAREELARRQTADIVPLEKAVNKIHSHWDAMHTRTAESRLLLCREAASLYGLKRQNKRHAKSETDGYMVGGLPIYNLKDLNSKNEPATVTTVNSTLAHLVHLVSHYLSLQLPAEIILPHRDHPYPTILPPGCSYATSGAPSSKATPENSSSSSRSAVRGVQLQGPKPLSLKKKISILAKEDLQSYAALVEGTSLLAWNIAWLCKTQGIDVGAGSWGEVCDVGNNLWKLFAAEQDEPESANSGQDRLTKQDVDFGRVRPKTLDSRPTQDKTVPTPPIAFGQYSHGTVHSNLSSTLGSKVMRGWRLQDPAKVIERVKQMLLSDRTGAGWEMLEGKEWENKSIIAAQSKAGVLADASTVVVHGRKGSKDIAEEANSDQNMPATDIGQEKGKGTSGWTKLKSR